MNEILYLIALRYCPNIGDLTIKRMIDYFGSAEKIWHSKFEERIKIYSVGKETAKYIGDAHILKKAISDLEYCQNNKISVLSIYEKEYPLLLKECNDAPVLLYYKGTINWNFPSISIVGTRKMTSYGKHCIHTMLDEITDKNINIISGLALGTDGEVHKKSVSLQLPTIGVLAHGLKKIYPPQHKLLANEMLQNGGIVTEFNLDAGFDKANFIQRNRIIAGLSPITFIVESAYGGGAISTAKFANSYNREVYAFPGKITDKFSQGCNQLIKNLEAQIITFPKEISSILGQDKQKPLQTELFSDLTQEEKQLVEFLREKGKCQIDELSAKMEMPTFQLMPILLSLELKSIVVPSPGKFFSLM